MSSRDLAAREEKIPATGAADGIIRRSWIRRLPIIGGIIERRRAARALRESKERFRSAFEHAVIGMALLAPDGRFLHINRSFSEMLGYSQEELTSTTWQTLTHPDDLGIGDDHMRRMLSGEIDSGHIEKRYVHKRGHVIWTLLSFRVLRDDRGDPLCFIAQIQDINERRQATQALQEGKERYQDLYENAPCAFFSVSADGLIQRCNRRAYELLGYAPGKLVGRPIFDLYADTEHGKAKASEVFQRFLAGETIREEELQMMKADGTPVWISLTVNALRDARGEVVESRSMVVDITERKRAEDALRQSEEWLSTTLGSIADAVIATDAEGRVRFLNPVAQAMTGWTQEESTGRALADIFVIVNEETGRPVEDPVAKVLREGLVVGLANHTTLVARDGTRRPIDDSGAPIRDAEGNITGVVLVFHDITERRRVEEAMRESEERYRALVELSPDAIVVQQDGKVVFVNAAGAELLRAANPEQLIGRHISDFIHPDYQEIVRERILDVETGKGPVSPLEEKCLRLDGTSVDVEVSGALVSHGGRPAAQVVIRDITERKRAEEALRESEERFRSTLDGMLEGCQIIGFDWSYLYVNDTTARHGRRTKEELVGHTMMEIYPGIEDSDMFRHLQRCMEERIPHRMENEFTYPDGDQAWFELSIQPVPEGIFVLSLDITERKRAEEALRESEEKYRDLVENLGETIYELDATGRITYISPFAEQAGDYVLSDMDGRPLANFIHPDDLERVMKAIEIALRGEPGAIEFRILTKSGEPRWHRSLARPVIKEGRAVGIRGVLTDITERKLAEEALEKAREELEARTERQMLRRNPYGLTFREHTVLHLVAAGESDKEIGTTLGISPLTAQKHISNILAKMDASSRTEAGVRAVREGLLE